MTQLTTSIASLLRTARLVAVLTIERLEDAVPLARALVAGGVRTLEVTLRTAAGADAAAAIQAEVPDAVVGIGTVLRVQNLELAHRLRLPFAFSPGATPELLDAAAAMGVPFVPGVGTASELMAAMSRGFTTVKLFPAEQVGGVGALRAFGGPFPGVLFNPTGGVTEGNMAAYLALPNVVAVGGSWMAPASDEGRAMGRDHRAGAPRNDARLRLLNKRRLTVARKLRFGRFTIRQASGSAYRSTGFNTDAQFLS